MKKFSVLLPAMLIFLFHSYSQVRQIIRKKEPASDQQVIQMPREPVKQTVAQAFSTIDLLGNPTIFLVLGKQRFANTIQPFIDHKNQKGISTAFVDIESLNSYKGVDEPEKIKRAIAEAYMKKGTRYVMLVGDASLFPVRHRYVSNGWANGRTGSPEYQWFEGSYNPTDLYYANLFHHNEYGEILPQPSFSSWDEDHDGLYNYQVWQFPGAEQMGIDAIQVNPDHVDGYPDIALARLPVHSEEELSLYIEKAIKYDNGQMIPESRSGLAFLASANYGTSTSLCEEIINYVTPGKINASDVQKFAFNFKQTPAGWDEGNFASVRNAAVFNWGIVYMGHASSQTWDLQDGDTKSFNDLEVYKFRNPLSLPVVFTLGCSSGRFKPNIPDCVPDPAGPYNDINEKNVYYEKSPGDKYYEMGNYIELPKNFRFPTPSPYDSYYNSNRTFACPWLFQPNKGGAIAFFGETVVCQNTHGTELIKRVLKSYTDQPRFLGDAWTEGQRQFWRDFRTNNDVLRNPRIYLSIMTFFGDPTLPVPPVN